MKFPCELLAEPYIAQLRIQTARNLKSRGYTQTEIAKVLQVSQPVISGYLKKSRNQENLPSEIMSRAISVASSITKILEEQGPSGTNNAIKVGCHECKVMRQLGPGCEYHKLYTEGLGEKCSSCHTGGDLIQLQENKFGVLTDLSQLLSRIYSLENLISIIPEIGLQIVHSTPKPTSASDIAAFPGRIIKRKARELLADTPSFGGSETTAHFLLVLREHGMDIRTMATLKSSKGLTNRIEKLDIKYFVIKGLEEDLLGHIEAVNAVSPPLCIVGEQSVGFESITYLCTQDIEEMMRILAKLGS